MDQKSLGACNRLLKMLMQSGEECVQNFVCTCTRVHMFVTLSIVIANAQFLVVYESGCAFVGKNRQGLSLPLWNLAWPTWSSTTTMFVAFRWMRRASCTEMLWSILWYWRVCTFIPGLTICVFAGLWYHTKKNGNVAKPTPQCCAPPHESRYPTISVFLPLSYRKRRPTITKFKCSATSNWWFWLHFYISTSNLPIFIAVSLGVWQYVKV